MNKMNNIVYFQSKTNIQTKLYLFLFILSSFYRSEGLTIPKTNLSARYARTLANSLHNLQHKKNPAFTKRTEMSSSTDSSSAAKSSDHKFKIRTITAFVKIHPSDFTTTFKHVGEKNQNETSIRKDVIDMKIEACQHLVQNLQKKFEERNYEVQTVRLATNPFAEYLLTTENSTDTLQCQDESVLSKVKTRLSRLDSILAANNFQFCSLGPSFHIDHTQDICPLIVKASPRFSCSANVASGDIDAATAASTCILEISKLGNECSESHVQGGLGNFRFCSVSSSRDFIPFFPGARCESLLRNDDNLLDNDNIGIALGLENGELAGDLLSKCNSIANIETTFREGMIHNLEPLQDICESLEQNTSVSHFSMKYLGIDNSLNPSLSRTGSVAKAIESLKEVQPNFGKQGTLAAAAAITTTLQSLPLKLTGYCGLMLPVCEDQRLAELGSQNELKISQLLCISSVCGVGVDTVPLSGDVAREELLSLILDVAALAGRWNKSLSCRVFPVPGLKLGEETSFDSPHLCNSQVFDMQ